MTASPSLAPAPPQAPGAPRIKVIGVGSGGVRAVDGMIAAGAAGVEFVVADTDALVLQTSAAATKLFMDIQSWEGLGIQSDVEIARLCATGHTEQIVSALKGSDVIFLVTALGGGAGCGASSVIAGIAQSLGALTLAAVAMPLKSGGERPTSQAESAVQELLQQADAVVIVPADKLLRRTDAADAAPATSEEALDAFILAGLMLGQAIQGIPGLISSPGLVNHDFLELRKTIAGTGKISMGIASRSGELRARDAAASSIASPLLRAGSLQAARVVLVNITGSKSLRIEEVNQVLTQVQASAHPSANILCGAVLDDQLEDDVRVTLMAAGYPDLPAEEAEARFPLQLVKLSPLASTTHEVRPTPESSLVPLRTPELQPAYSEQQSQEEDAVASVAADASQSEVPASRLWSAQEAEQLSTQSAFPAAAASVVSSRDSRIQQVKQAALQAYSAAEQPDDANLPEQDAASFSQILRKRFRAAIAGAIRPLSNR